MGGGMARRLLENNTDLVVWNRTPSVSETLQDEYPGRVTVARSASEVIGACDTTFSMLSTPEVLTLTRIVGLRQAGWLYP